MTTEIAAFAAKHPLLKHLPITPDFSYFSEDTFHQIQPHLSLLLSNKGANSVYVDPNHIDLYAGDFYGYLKRYQPSVPYELYWLSARVSGMNGPNDFDKRFNHIYVLTDVSILNKVVTSKKAVQKSGI
jgi:hypothetical protein